RVHKDKCGYGVTGVEFLGFSVKDSMYGPTAAKVEKIKMFTEPMTRKDLSSFLGVVGQYRVLIKDFSAKARCLYDCLNKWKGNKKPAWTPKHQEAMDQLKQELTKPPVAMLPDVTKPFIVQTDASKTGMGAVLLQEIDGHRRVI